MEIKLLPCPFCGGENLTLGYAGQPATYMYVECTDCGCCGANTKGNISPSGFMLPDSADLAVKAWNDRVS